MEAIGYLRVSTEDQEESRAGLDAQRSAIEAWARIHGHSIHWIEDPGFSAKSLTRPGIQRALEQLARGERQAIVVAKLDRLSRSLLDFAALLKRSNDEGWSVVALDLQVDTSTPTGAFLANVLMAIAEWERGIIAQRTREALAEKRRRGVRLGRPREISPEVVTYIATMSSVEGLSARAIARRLTAEGIPTGHGGRWHHTTVQRLLEAAA